MTRRKWALVLGLLLLVLLVGCDWEAGDDDDDDDVSNTPAGWAWGINKDGSLTFSFADRELFQLLGVDRETFKVDSSMLFGQFDLARSSITTQPFAFRMEDQKILLTYGGVRTGELVFEITEAGNLRVVVLLDEAYYGDGMRLHFPIDEDDRFWGFGEQYNMIDFRGQTVPIWVSEQGLGREDGMPVPPKGNYMDTYFPMPYFMDPEAGKGFLIENTEYSQFDIGTISKAKWTAQVWNGRACSFMIFPGPKPANVVSQLTAEVGRPEQSPPDWAFSGVWLAAQGGTDAIRERMNIALNAGIPVTALWVQDWLGIRDFGLGNYGVKYHWSHDEELYPGLAGFIAEMRSQNVRFLGYFNPFVAPAYEHYEQMADYGYLIKTPEGDPYSFLVSTFKASLPDLTNPQVVDYFQAYAFLATQMGQSGWMCDFGEWLPYDAALLNDFAPSYHNLYPIEWQRINRDVLDAAYPDGDYAMFTRSGFTGVHKVAQIVWMGDQEATWDTGDGLPTVVNAGLTLGLAGIPVVSHDIAGFSGGPSTKELFLRWTELGAFTPVMRTHDGLQKLENHRFDTDEETLTHFTRMAKIHAAIAPYWLVLMDEAMDHGLPMIRHTVLVDPDWERSYDAHGQWMLGNDFLFVPVVEEGAYVVDANFPEGQWEHLFTGEVYNGRNTYTVRAHIGNPAVFVRQGTWGDVVEAVRAVADNE